MPRKPKPDPPAASPWWTCKEIAAYLRKSDDFVRDEINAGRLKAARIGSKRTILSCQKWCDEWVVAQAEVHPFRPIRKIGS